MARQTRQNKRKGTGGLSILRIGLIAALVGGLLIVAAVVSFFVDRASHQVPLEIAPYPGSVVWGTRTHSGFSRTLFYQVTGASADDVAAYYQRKIEEMFGANQEQCERFPPVGNFPEFDRGNPTVAPFQYSCMFDRSGFQITQYTRVNIQPGISANGTEGMIIVEHQQVWQP